MEAKDKQQHALALAKVEGNAIIPQTVSELTSWAGALSKSGMVPKHYEGNPGAIIAAVQMGREVGMSPMQSLLGIAVINGRPSMYGDALLGLVRKSGLCEYISEWIEDAPDGDVVAYCETTRKGDPRKTLRVFSKQDAIRASLWGKAGPWKQYPQRMLQMRARSWCLRDVYPDVLMGFIQAEEARDIQYEIEETVPLADRVAEAAEKQAAQLIAAEEAAARYPVEAASFDSTDDDTEPEYLTEDQEEALAVEAEADVADADGELPF